MFVISFTEILLITPLYTIPSASSLNSVPSAVTIIVFSPTVGINSFSKPLLRNLTLNLAKED